MGFNYDFHWFLFLKNSLEKRINKALKVLILIFPISLIFYFLLSDINGNKDLLTTSKYLYKEIFYGIILISIGYVLRYLRWRMILNNFQFSPSKNLESRLWLASFSFATTPGKVGELIRCYFLRKVFNIPLKYSLVSILLERFYDLFTVLFITITFSFLNLKEYIFNISLYTFWLVFIAIIFLKVIRSNKPKILKFIRLLLGKVFFKKLGIPMDSESINWKSFFYFKIVWKLFALSIFSWSLEGLAFYLILSKSNIPVNFLQASFMHTSAGLLGILTMIPGGIGSTEAITIAMFNYLEIPFEISFPITSLIRLMTIWYITVLGLFSFLTVQKTIFNESKTPKKFKNI